MLSNIQCVTTIGLPVFQFHPLCVVLRLVIQSLVNLQQFAERTSELRKHNKKNAFDFSKVFQ